jgi:hypothetical protein
MYSSKTSWEYILLSNYEQETAFLGIYKLQSEQNRRFLLFSYIPGGIGAYLTPLTPSTNTPCPSTPPTNILCTKQFLSRPHCL